LRSALELIESRLEAGERGEALIAFVAATGVSIPVDELQSATRRAMLVLAAGGDPHRELELDSRAVAVLVRDLETPERRAALSAGLAALRESAAELPRTSALLATLESDPGLAWRALACALLADELGDE
jgi:hypothetical protein